MNEPVSMTHVAMRVMPDTLRSAEEFYKDLFGMKVAFRETMTPGGWSTLPEEDVWSFTDSKGVAVGLIMLYRDGLALDLEARTDGTRGAGVFSHVGLHTDAAELERVRRKAPELGCEVTYDQPHMVVFNDPYGMRWEVTTLSYTDPLSLSAGRRVNQWFHA